MTFKSGFVLVVSLLALGAAPKTSNERLIEAARDGHLDEVKVLIRDGTKVDARDDTLATPLILAAKTGQVEIVEALLRVGADVNAKDDVNGTTALMFAAAKGNARLVHVLLDVKAKVNVKDEVGVTALHLAARGGKLEVMELLLAAGANGSAQDSCFLGTPLHHAAIGGSADAVRCLLRHGCPVNLRDSDGATPLHSATIGRNASTNVVKVLLEAGADINAEDAADGSTPLMWAADSEQPAVLQFLIQSHADLNKTDNLGWTALMHAKFAGNVETAKTLKQSGGLEYTSLSYAAANGDLAAVKSLLAEHSGRRPKQKELDDALCLAVQKPHADIVKELLAHGSNPNARLNGDSTPLLFACQRGDVEIARQLLAAGANVTQSRIYRNGPGSTPLMYAAQSMPAEFLNELISKGAHVNAVTDHFGPPIAWAVLGGKFDNVKTLFQHGARIDVRKGKPDAYVGWPIVMAVRRGDVQILDFLLDHGADINTKDSDGKTVLMYAVQRDKVDVVKLLIARGANVSAQADYDYNNTALKLAENTGKMESAALLRIIDEESWGTKLKRVLAESMRAKLEDRPTDHAAMIELTKEIVASPDTLPALKADARYLAALADLETLKSSDAVSNATARTGVEADIVELRKDHSDDVRAATVQRQLEAILVSRAQRPLDLKFKAVDGTEVNLAKLRGKVVLVDFWATWCGPCRVEIPKVVATYNQLHKDGFEVIGISLDQNKEKLHGFTKQAGMTWPQYFDGKGWANEISTRYGINSIPTAWLVDKKGFIRSTEVRGEKLAVQVKALLAE